MKQSLTAAIAFTFAAGMAGAAFAQGAAHPGATPLMTPAAPSSGDSATTPGASTSPMGTQTAVPKDEAPEASAMNRSARNLSRATLREAQEKLKAQGLYNGPIDGIEGDQMRAAIKRYQSKNALPETATLDQPTLDHLLGNRTSGYGSSGAPGSSLTTPAPSPQSPAEGAGGTINGAGGVHR